MKVIANRRNNQTGEIVDVSWGNNITSDFSVIGSVVDIIGAHRAQEAAVGTPDHNPVLDRFTTIAIRIEL